MNYSIVSASHPHGSDLTERYHAAVDSYGVSTTPSNRSTEDRRNYVSNGLLFVLNRVCLLDDPDKNESPAIPFLTSGRASSWREVLHSTT
jgi:hypothetical protein